MISLALRGSAAATLVLLLACAEKKDHPPLVGGCATGQRCPVNFGNGNLGQQPGGGEGGEGGQGGEGAEGELRGRVLDLIDDTFATVQSYTERAIVEGRRSDGGVVSAQWNGADPFVLMSVEAMPASWISVRPERGQLGLRTLHAVATNITRRVDLGIVRRETFDLIYGVLSAPATLAPGTAQVVLRFSDGTAAAAGVSGVRAAAPEASFIAYRNGASWSIDSSATDGSGLLVLGNIGAVAFPGGTQRVRLSGTASGYVDIAVAADGVTLVEIQLSP